jgi:hypothetical protein
MAVCEHCGCKVIGHGVVVQGSFYCCGHCGRHVHGDAPVRDCA